MNKYYCLKFQSEMTCDSHYFLSLESKKLDTLKNAFYDFTSDKINFSQFEKIRTDLNIIYLTDAINEVIESKIHESSTICLTHDNITYLLESMDLISFRF